MFTELAGALLKQISLHHTLRMCTQLTGLIIDIDSMFQIVVFALYSVTNLAITCKGAA